MEIRAQIEECLSQGKVMQLATADNGRPWICTVFYVFDEELNLYWLSLPDHRHSLEIAKSNKVAITVPIKFDLPVVAVQAEGDASTINDPDKIKMIMEKYINKYDSGKSFHANFLAGKNQHVMYKFTPTTYVLFDELNYPDEARKQLKM